MFDRSRGEVTKVSGARSRSRVYAVAGVACATVTLGLLSSPALSMPAPDQNRPHFMAFGVADISADDVYLSGADVSTHGEHTWQLRHWDGHAWSTTAEGAAFSNLTRVTALSADDVWAVGQSQTDGLFALHGQPGAWETSSIEDATNWHPTSIVTLSDSDVWVVGTIEYEGERSPK